MEKKDGILHLWENELGELLTHASTGLRFLCLRRKPGPPTRNNWDVLYLVTEADGAQINREAALSSMKVEDYIEYLGTTAIELAAKATKKKRR